MPETTREWAVFALGLLAVGVLCALIVAGRNPTSSLARHGPTTASVRAPTEETRTAPARALRAKHDTRTVGETAIANQLRLTAKADTWVSVRRDPPSGSVLFEGTMLAHKAKTFTGMSFRVRFGAAANVAATLNGKPLGLPSGTYSVTIGRDGLGPRSA